MVNIYYASRKINELLRIICAVGNWVKYFITHPTYTIAMMYSSNFKWLLNDCLSLRHCTSSIIHQIPFLLLTCHTKISHGKLRSLKKLQLSQTLQVKCFITHHIYNMVVVYFSNPKKFLVVTHLWDIALYLSLVDFVNSFPLLLACGTKIPCSKS